MYKTYLMNKIISDINEQNYMLKQPYEFCSFYLLRCCVLSSGVYADAGQGRSSPCLPF